MTTYNVEQEKQWLEEALEGNKDSFGKLIEAFQGPVFNLAYRMLGNADEAEQAAQEAFIRAYTRLDSYNPAYKFSTWMLSITSNYCVDLLRKRRALMLSIDEPLPPHPALMSEKESGPEAHALDREKEAKVQALLDTLQPDYRQAIILRYWYEMSYAEIASAMDTTVSAIKSRLFRARRDLAEANIELGVFPQPEEVPA